MAPIVCPVNGVRLVLVSSTNGTGDAMQRWECPSGDWEGPWFVGGVLGGDPIPEVTRRGGHLNLAVSSRPGAPAAAPSPTETRLDYDALNNLIYSGKAPNGSATTAAVWTISKLTYTGANLTRVQTLAGLAWDSRVGAAW